jgi:hypothetical protein
MCIFWATLTSYILFKKMPVIGVGGLGWFSQCNDATRVADECGFESSLEKEIFFPFHSIQSHCSVSFQLVLVTVSPRVKQHLVPSSDALPLVSYMSSWHGT